jgi:hypothetical protein
MKIFVGWPYDATWVEDYVNPLIETYGIEVLDGKELEGQSIKEGVKEKMKSAQAGLFFLTLRDDPKTGGLYKTSDWVIDEIKHANSIDMKTIIEVREAGVLEYANKIHTERQHILFDPADRMKLLVRLGEIMGTWRGQSLKLKLLPIGLPNDKQFFTDDLRRRLKQHNYKCSYHVRQKSDVIHGPHTVQIVREDFDHYYIYTGELPDAFFNSQDMYLEVDIIMGDNQWSCPGIRPNVLEAPLENLDRLQRQPDGGPA